MRIGTNITSLIATRHLSSLSKAMSRAVARLASGQKTVADDVTSLRYSVGVTSQIRSIAQSIKSMNHAQGAIQTAWSAMQEQVSILQRIRDLAVQAANGIYSDQDRSYLHSEVTELVNEYDRIQRDTSFGTEKLLDGSFGTKSIQVGANKGENISISLGSLNKEDHLYVEDFENRGDGTFSSVKTTSSGIATIGGSDRFETADFNGDGYDDLAIYDYNSAFYIYLGNGDGTFKFKSSTTLAGNSMTSGDFNNDGETDLMFVSASTYTLYRGFGDGTFAFSATGTMSGTRDIRSGDFNNDGNLDFMTLDPFAANIRLGNGDGTFQAMTFFTPISGGNDLGIADVNNDGNLDAIVGNGYIGVNLGTGSGTFAATVTSSTATVWSGNRQTFLVDLNGDGNLDYLSNENGLSAMFTALGNGNGTFANATTIATTGTVYIRPSDINGDGYTDVMIFDNAASSVTYRLSNSSGVLGSAQTLATGISGGSHFFSGDFNNDDVNDFTTIGTTFSTFISGSQEVQLDDRYVDISVLTQDEASDTIEAVDHLMEAILSEQAELSASVSRLEFALNNNANLSEQLSQIRSESIDIDYSQELAEFTRLQILNQATISVLSQSNIQMKLVLDLIK